MAAAELTPLEVGAARGGEPAIGASRRVEAAPAIEVLIVRRGVDHEDDHRNESVNEKARAGIHEKDLNQTRILNYSS